MYKRQAYICRKWEKEAEQVTPQTRLVITRLAPLLSTDGGIFPPVASLFRYGLGAVSYTHLMCIRDSHSILSQRSFMSVGKRRWLS